MPSDPAARARVLDHVLAHPGLNVSEIARRLGVDPTTADYHLHRLERAKFVVARRGTRGRYYYPSGVCPMLRVHGRALVEAAAEAHAVLAGARTTAAVAAAVSRGHGPSRRRLQTLARAGFILPSGPGRFLPAPDLERCLAALDRGARCPLWGRCAPSRPFREAEREEGFTAFPRSSATASGPDRSTGPRCAP